MPELSNEYEDKGFLKTLAGYVDAISDDPDGEVYPKRQTLLVPGPGGKYADFTPDRVDFFLKFYEGVDGLRGHVARQLSFTLKSLPEGVQLIDSN